MSRFDTYADRAFSATVRLMGYPATWTQDNGQQVSALVHYNNPSADDGIGDINYRPEIPAMEYRYGGFPGLKEALDRHELQTVTIQFRGALLEFTADRAETKFDGRTITVYLILKPLIKK